MPTCIIAIWIKPSISPSASKIRFFRVKILLSHTFTLTLQQKTHRYRDVAQLVSVRVWGACGRQFESGHPDKSKVKSLTASHLRLIKSSKIGEKSANGCLLIQRFSIGHFTQKFKKCLKKNFIPRINEVQRSNHTQIINPPMEFTGGLICENSVAYLGRIDFCLSQTYTKPFLFYWCKSDFIYVWGYSGT